MSPESLKKKLLDRYRGCLLGIAIGDALGFPLEGSSASFVHSVGPKIVHSFRAARGGLFEPGQYSALTQLAIANVESLCSFGTLDPREVAERYTEYWRENTLVGKDERLRAALERFAQTGDLESAGCAEGIVGPAAIPRALILGLWYYDDPDGLRQATTFSTRITHRDPETEAIAQLTAALVVYLVTHREVVLGELLSDLSESVPSAPFEYSPLLSEVTKLIALPEQEAVAEVIASELPGEQFGEEHAKLWQSLMIALFYFLRYPNDFDSCVRGALEAHPWRALTTSIAAALYGGFHGADELPGALVEDLIHGDQLLLLGERLHERRHA